MWNNNLSKKQMQHMPKLPDMMPQDMMIQTAFHMMQQVVVSNQQVDQMSSRQQVKH